MANESEALVLTQDDVTFDSRGRAIIADKSMVAKLTALLNEQGSISVGNPSRMAAENSGCTNFYCPPKATLALPKDVLPNWPK